MRLLVDENIHRKVVEELRRNRHDVLWIKDVAPGIADSEILARDDISNFVFVTNDRDFGELIFAKNMPSPAAILYTRMPHRDWKLTAERLMNVIENGLAPGQFVTIETANTRYKPLPTLD